MFRGAPRELRFTCPMTVEELRGSRLRDPRTVKLLALDDLVRDRWPAPSEAGTYAVLRAFSSRPSPNN